MIPKTKMNDEEQLVVCRRVISYVPSDTPFNEKRERIKHLVDDVALACHHASRLMRNVGVMAYEKEFKVPNAWVNETLLVLTDTVLMNGMGVQPVDPVSIIMREVDGEEKTSMTVVLQPRLTWGN